MKASSDAANTGRAHDLAIQPSDEQLLGSARRHQLALSARPARGAGAELVGLLLGGVETVQVDVVVVDKNGLVYPRPESYGLLGGVPDRAKPNTIAMFEEAATNG